ncbi:MAG: nucleoside/nucleotide kinase family protein [Planctomycetes bacterium]|nr:nucleoside/nucleotide kinase family protein [Planctomycetota bacterium]
MPDFELNLDGQPSRLAISVAELEAVHVPLLRNWESQWQRNRGRFIVFLAGPPGAGKTTLAGLWEQLARQGRIGVPVQRLSMDGFHHPNRVLDTRSITLDGVDMPLRRIKGRPESFDLPALRRALIAIRAGQHVRWPSYDRTRHDPVPDATPVLSEGILVVEGLYLLLDLPGWDQLRDEADHGVFVDCPEDALREDVVTRKHRQGRSYDDAMAHWHLVDHTTWQITSRHRRGVDTVIRLRERRCYELGGTGPTNSLP